MLRERTTTHQKDQNMGQLNSDVVSETYVHSDFLVNTLKNNSFLSVPGLFVGFNSKNSESDSVRSPTSPLDFRVFSDLGNSFRSPRLSREGAHHQKTWDGNKVGLSIVDSLDYEAKQSGKVLLTSYRKNILLGPQMRTKTPNVNNHTDSFEASKSLPKGVGIFPCANSRPSNLQKGSSDVIFETGELPTEPDSCGNLHPHSLGSGRSGSHLSHLGNHNYNLSPENFGSENRTFHSGSPSHVYMGSKFGNSSGAEQCSIPKSVAHCLIGSIPPSEIELSEDYTCVRKHGPNPKVTHIFCDCILECRNNDLTNFGLTNEEDNILPQAAESLGVPVSYPSSDFLSFCYSCEKKLGGEDIYMYRSEKAFCSCTCRLEEILIDEEGEKSNNSVLGDSAKPSSSEKHTETCLLEKSNNSVSDDSAKPSSSEKNSKTGLFISA